MQAKDITITTGQALLIMNQTIREFSTSAPIAAKKMKQLRHHLVRKWLHDGTCLQYSRTRFIGHEKGRHTHDNNA